MGRPNEAGPNVSRTLPLREFLVCGYRPRTSRRHNGRVRSGSDHWLLLIAIFAKILAGQ